MPFYWSAQVAPLVHYSRRVRRSRRGPKLPWGWTILAAIPICLVWRLEPALGIFAFSIALYFIFSTVDRHYRAGKGLPPRTVRDWLYSVNHADPTDQDPPQAHYSNRR
jgi:hypothetical protein